MSRRTARMVFAVVAAVGAVGFTTTAMTVGTRGMADELGLSTTELGWVVNAYLVAAAALVLVGARLGDVIGRVRTFTLGTVVFALASVVGAISPGFAALVAARVGQGVGAALVLPASIELITAYAQPGREGAWFRWRSLVYASSFAVGPLIAGVLTDWASWRWIFVIDIVIAVVAGSVAVGLLGRTGRGSTAPTRDFTGAVLAAVLVAAVVLFAERLAVWDLVSIHAALAVVVLGGLTGVLVRHERRTPHPLVHPELLRDRLVLGANVATVGASIGMLGLLYFFNLFAQSAASLDSSALSVVAALVPFVASLMVCAHFANWLGHRVGPRWPAVVGLALMTVGFGLLATTSGATTRSQLIVPLAITGLGAGIANASLTSVAVLDLPAGRMNEAAGWISLSRFLGSAMAIAVGTAAFLSVGGPAPANDDAAVIAPENAFDVAAATLDRDLSGPMRAASEAETAERFSRTMLLTTIVLAVATVTSWWLMGPRRRAARAARAAPSGDR